MHRRVDERRPARIALGRVVTVDITVADGRDRAPEVVRVLGVEDRDQRVVHGHRGGRQEPRVLGHVAAGHGGDRARHRPVDGGSGRLPELGDDGLLRATLGAVLPADRLDLVVVTRPRRAGQAGRGAGPELIPAGHDPRRSLAPVGHGREQRRHIDAGRRVGAIRVGMAHAVLAGQAGRRRLLADRDPAGLRRAVGHWFQGGLIVGLDRRLLGRHELQEHRPGRGGHRGVDRRAGRGGDLHACRRVARGDRVDRLEHRHLHERHDPHGRRSSRVPRGDIGGPGVRVGHDVGLDAEGSRQCRDSQDERGDQMFQMHALHSFMLELSVNGDLDPVNRSHRDRGRVYRNRGAALAPAPGDSAHPERP